MRDEASPLWFPCHKWIPFPWNSNEAVIFGNNRTRFRTDAVMYSHWPIAPFINEQISCSLHADRDLCHLRGVSWTIYRLVGVNTSIRPINTGMKGYLIQNQCLTSECSGHIVGRLLPYEIKMWFLWFRFLRNCIHKARTCSSLPENIKSFLGARQLLLKRQLLLSAYWTENRGKGRKMF